MTKILYRNSEKIFLECEKKGFKKHLPALFPREFFHVCIINYCIVIAINANHAMAMHLARAIHGAAFLVATNRRLRDR